MSQLTTQDLESDENRALSHPGPVLSDCEHSHYMPFIYPDSHSPLHPLEGRTLLKDGEMAKLTLTPPLTHTHTHTRFKKRLAK